MKNEHVNEMKIVCVYDKALEAYLNPFVCPALGGAIRSFMDETKNPESTVHSHKEDYTLHLIGYFNINTGALTPCTPQQIAAATDGA